jgi:hypothetical protein
VEGGWSQLSKGKDVATVHRNRSGFQLGLEDDLNAFISFIVFRKTFEQSKAVDNM